MVYFRLGPVIQESSELRERDPRSRAQEHLQMLPFAAIPGHLNSGVLVVPILPHRCFEVGMSGLR